MKNEKIVEIQEYRNGSRISWPNFLVNNWEATNFFYTRGLPNTNLPKTKFAVMESRHTYEQEGLINYTGPMRSPVGSVNIPNLIDVLNTEGEAKQMCKEKTLELAKEKARGKYKIVQKSIDELVISDRKILGLFKMRLKKEYMAL